MVTFNKETMVKETKGVENPLDKWYKSLLRDIVMNGTKKMDRTGTGTISVFGRTFRHKMSDGFPLLTSKKMYTKGVIVELLWFLGSHMTSGEYTALGRTNIKYLLDNNCNIWVGDAYKNYLTKAIVSSNPFDYKIESVLRNQGGRITEYKLDGLFSKEEFVNQIKNDLEFARRWGDLGPIYGKQWCSWGEDEIVEITAEKLCTPVETIDELHEAVIEESCEIEEPTGSLMNLGGYNQINKLIHDLKENPDSRRLMVTAWNPIDVPKSVLPPCHYGFQCYTRELSEYERKQILRKRMGDAEYNAQFLNLNFSEQHIKTDQGYYNIPLRELSLSWNQRSVDTPLGLPFNIASYGFLLEILANLTEMQPGELIGNLGDTHIYLDQLGGVVEQLQNETYALPTLKIREDQSFRKVEEMEWRDFTIEGYQSAGKVEYPLSN